jgi:tetratricopeptide (TPR) repeat protein
MRFKYVFFLAALSLSGLEINVFAKTPITDTLAATKKHKIVKIGPQELNMLPLEPVVDSAVIRENARLAKIASDKAIKETIDAGFNKAKEDISLKNYQNTHLLNTLLNNTETSEYPAENIIATLDKALETYKKAGDIKSQSLIMNTYAVYYGRKGDIETAIPYFHQAIRLKELSKDKIGAARISGTLASVYKILGKYDEAITYNETSIRLNAGLKSRNQIARIYANIATLKALQHKYDESEYYIMKKALPAFQYPRDQNGRMACFVNLADMYQLQNRYSEAKWFYLQGISLSKLLNDKKTLVHCLMNLAHVKTAIGDGDLAILDYKEAERIAAENNYIDLVVNIKSDLGDTYRRMGNYAAAGTALKEYTELRDILLSSDN